MKLHEKPAKTAFLFEDLGMNFRGGKNHDSGSMVGRPRGFGEPGRGVQGVAIGRPAMKKT